MSQDTTTPKGEKLAELAILEAIWQELRTKSHLTASDVMVHLAKIIMEKRGDGGDTDNFTCGCGCNKIHYYHGFLGYEAMVCSKCGQHYETE